MTRFTRRRRERILLDTGPLYALLDARDQHYANAVSTLERLDEMRAEVLCAYPAALETHRLMLTRSRVDVSRTHELIIEVSGEFPFVMATDEDGQRALRFLLRYDDQKISLTDATIAAMSIRLKASVMTFDRRQGHFRLMGANVLEVGL